MNQVEPHFRSIPFYELTEPSGENLRMDHRVDGVRCGPVNAPTLGIVGPDPLRLFFSGGIIRRRT